MTKLRIQGRWDMDVPDNPDGWFAQWALPHLKKASLHVSQSALVFRDLYDRGVRPRAIVEYFGGLGCQTLLLHDLWPRVTHVVMENNPQAVEHLRGLGLPPQVSVVQGDAYREKALLPDLQVADFGNLSAHKMATDTPHSRLLDRIFSGTRQAVVLTDTAGAWLQIHREAYARALGAPVPDYPTYLRLMHQYVAERWGYYPAVTRWRHWSSVTSYLPERAKYPRIIHQKEDTTPRGMELVETDDTPATSPAAR